MNVVVLKGSLSSPPVERQLPSGDRIISYEVTTRGDAATAESVPVVWLDAPVRGLQLPEGAEVVVTGRVRRRFFRANGATGSRTEVVATEVMAITQRRRVGKALDAAMATLDVDAWL